METMNATDAKREFGAILLKSQKEPVMINKNGKPVAVIISAGEYESLISASEEWLKAQIQRGMDDLKAGRVVDGKDVMRRLRKQVVDATV